MLKSIEKELVRCNLKCDGVSNNPKRGIIPRGLVLEKRKGKHNCIVVGLNPGKCKKEEKKYYHKEGVKSDSFSRYFFESRLNERRYYKRTRDLITLLGFDGDILWTDLAKCECRGKNGRLPIQTLRVCINRFLKKEIKNFKSTTIFTLGNRAFDFCSLSFPNHFIVGVPHPSGSYGDFDRLKRKVISRKRSFKKEIKNRMDNNNHYKAIRLSEMLK